MKRTTFNELYNIQKKLIEIYIAEDNKKTKRMISRWIESIQKQLTINN